MVASQARKQAESADAEKTIALMAVFEPLLGIKTEDELKSLSLEQVRKRARQRLQAGAVRLQGIAADLLLDRVIQQTQARRNVSWKDQFLDALGESRAAAVLADTPETYSYKLVLP